MVNHVCALYTVCQGDIIMDGLLDLFLILTITLSKN